MNHKRQTQVINMAVQLLNEHGLYDNPPTDLFALAEAMKISVMSWDFGDEILGVLIGNKGEWVIGHNTRFHREKIRFLIAHCIGHIVLGHQSSMFVVFPKVVLTQFTKPFADCSPGRQEQDHEANAFAASLLIPHNTLLRQIDAYIAEHNSCDGMAQWLADKFAVTPDFMLLRMGMLNLVW